MSMSKKDFIALADAIREPLKGPIMIHETGKPQVTIQDNILNALADFCQASNPNFKRDRWLSYIAGTCGKNGGKIKVSHD